MGSAGSNRAPHTRHLEHLELARHPRKVGHLSQALRPRCRRRSRAPFPRLCATTPGADDDTTTTEPDWLDHVVAYYLHAGRFMGAVIWPVIVGSMTAGVWEAGSTPTSDPRPCWWSVP